MEDLSCGLELKPIPWESGDQSSPTKFRYITRSIPGPGCDLDKFMDHLAGCDCRGSCQLGLCPCLQRFGQNYDDRTHCLLPVCVSNAQLKPVFECNSQCKCDVSCHNRLIQHGPQIQLKVSKSDATGFGLHAHEDIKQLEFVCEYAGEVVGVAEAGRRLREMENDTNYLIVLQEHCASGVVLTCVDPRHVGNVGRFANHSCDPNMLMVPIRVDHGVPRLALFACRDIAAGEELTFDYSGETLLDNSQKKAECLFKSTRDTSHSQSGCTGTHFSSESKALGSAEMFHRHKASLEVLSDGVGVSQANSCKCSFDGRIPLDSNSQGYCLVCQQSCSDNTLRNCSYTDSSIHTSTNSERNGIIDNQKSCGRKDFRAKTGDDSKSSMSEDRWTVGKRKLSFSANGPYSADEYKDTTGCIHNTCTGTRKSKPSLTGESSIPNVSHSIIRKKCLCGNGKCKGFLPYDELIFMQ